MNMSGCSGWLHQQLRQGAAMHSGAASHVRPPGPASGHHGAHWVQVWGRLPLVGAAQIALVQTPAFDYELSLGPMLAALLPLVRTWMDGWVGGGSRGWQVAATGGPCGQHAAPYLPHSTCSMAACSSSC